MKDRIKTILKKFPYFYKLIQSFYWTIGSIKANLLGTQLQEKRWAQIDFDFEKAIQNLYYPHRKFLVNEINKYEPENILEIGCGYGPNLYWLAKKFPQSEIFGIDINKKAIEEGEKYFKKENIFNVKLITGKADDIERFPDKTFDIIFTDATLMCLGSDRIKKIIREMFRVSKKAIILVEWHIENKEEYDAHIGVWKRNYLNLLKEFIPEKRISLTKITPEMWPDKNWQKYGHIIEVKL